MMIKVVIHAEGLLEWGGGIDFLKFYLSIFNQLDHLRTILIIPYDQFDQKIIRKIKDCIKKIIGLPIYSRCTFDAFWKDYPHIEPQLYRRGTTPSCLKDADVVFLTMQPVKGVEQSKVIGYIPDLQHIYFPSFFTEKERSNRDTQFIKMLEQCGTIFVNSQHTLNSLKEYFPVSSAKCNFYSMSFLPLANNFGVLETNIEKYNLPERYFMFSNQLWMHKDLPTALRAISLLIHDEQYKDVMLICSGATYDYRNPDYFSKIEQLVLDFGISENVRFLGFIPKSEQLAIMRNSISVVQTTLFEGGPGGGATYDAVAYGSSAIISDIEVNLEIIHERVSFFKAGDSENLCLRMKERLVNSLKPLSISILEKQRELNNRRACMDIDKLITDVFQNSKKCSSI